MDEVVVGRRSPRLEAAARAAGSRVTGVAEGSSMNLGRVRIDVLWPPWDHVANPIAEANDDSLILAVRFGGFDALITGDAEAEATHLDPGPFDVLKVAHHGSDDSGLPTLLDRSVPRVALIGVGADNGYGHPTPELSTRWPSTASARFAPISTVPRPSASARPGSRSRRRAARICPNDPAVAPGTPERGRRPRLDRPRT